MGVNIRQTNALVVDDSPVILSSVRRMLVQVGIQDKHIYHAKDPKAAIWHAKKIAFDLIVCDYNFHAKLNGKQVFEELKHYNLITSNTSFIVITGESLSKIVRSIIELNPDEYVLKPFNSEFFLNKVRNTLERKYRLKKLYELKEQRKYQEGLAACDEAEFDCPKYYYLIQKFRAEFFSLLNMHKEAKDLYKTIITDRDVEWANNGLADSLLELGEFSEAQKVIERMLDKMPNSTKALSLNAKYDIYNGEIPNAIKQYSMISDLVPGNPDRELIIANLCVSQSDFETAASRFMMYYNINLDTYRDSLEARYNYIRCLLFIYDYQESLGQLDPERTKKQKSLKSEAISEFHSLTQLKEKNDVVVTKDSQEHQEVRHIEQELFMCHISIIEGRFSESMVLLKHIYNNKLAHEFYDLYHLLYLLNKLNYHNEFNQTVKSLEKIIEKSDISPMVLKSRIELVHSLVSQNKHLITKIDETFGESQKLINSRRYSEAVDKLIELKLMTPYIREVNSSIINCLGHSWPSGYTGRNTKRLLESCMGICEQLYTHDEIVSMNIKKMHSLAEEKLSKHF
ncbi:response regulator [Vibrio splendidus]|uniref:response regulator n=1 Tax=Vibrio splendidus TaxID=29497 RepID=UPI0024698298|nr:response regulator [Vibrio splendidus]MDH5918929.1 response regulator [Vibrio splendidus]